MTGITGGLTVTVDPRPLTIAQEIAALITGKTTYDLALSGRSLYLERRCLTRIRAPRIHPVVAVHPCRGAAQHPVPAAPVPLLPDDPPF